MGNDKSKEAPMLCDKELNKENNYYFPNNFQMFDRVGSRKDFL